MRLASRGSIVLRVLTVVALGLLPGCGAGDEAPRAEGQGGARAARAPDAADGRDAPGRGAARPSGAGARAEAGTPAGERVAPRNLLLISIDTLRADALGTYGSKTGATPNIDAFAARSIVFESAWTHSPKTAPAHMSMFTGLPPSVHGVGNLNTSLAQQLPKSIRTLSQALQDSGFRTAAFTGGGNVKGSLGFARGFDSYDDLGEPLDAKLRKVEPWIRSAEQADQPWYCFLHTYHIHDPYFPDEPFASRFTRPAYSGPILSTRAAVQAAIDRGDDLAPTMKGHEKITWNYWYRVRQDNAEDLEHLRNLYTAGVAHMDELVGAFLARLARQGVLDDTLVVFTSDHGEEFGEHGEVRHDQLWVECAHVPLVVRLPGEYGAGLRIPETVRHVDLTPSILDLLAIEGHGLEPLGASWAGWLEPGAERGAPRLVIGEHQSRRETPLDVFSVREEHLLLMDRIGTVELFDRRHDRREKRPVKWPKVQDRLATLLAENRAAHAALASVVGAGGRIEMTPELRAELEALGYVGGDSE
jgi:arylsulfatase A-like enzyme